MLKDLHDKLIDFEKIVLQRTYEHWKESGEWPKSLPLAVEYRNQGDLFKVAKQLGYHFINVGSPHNRTSECKLTALGIALCEGSEDFIEKVFSSVQFGVKKFIDNPLEERITSDEIQEMGRFSDVETRQICKILYDSHDFFSGGSATGDGQYSLSMSYNILEYENIKNIEDYIQIRRDSFLPRFGGKIESPPIEAYYPGDQEYYDGNEIEQYVPIDVSFISDSNIRTLVERDLEELHKILNVGAWKSATIISASIAESLLLDLFKSNEEIARRTLKKKWPNKVTLWDMAHAAGNAGLISEPEHAFFELMRTYRNQIHPDRACYEKRPDEFVANGLYEFVQKLLKDMKERV